MAAVLKQWREAATLIVVTAKQKGLKINPNFVSSSAAKPHAVSPAVPKGADYEVLLLKRSSKSKFMPNVYVFPGGVASDVDFSADWIPVFDWLGKDQRQEVFDFVQRGGQGAPMFSRLRDKTFSHIPSEIAFRICAIRETFEESGVLIVRRVEGGEEFQPSLWDKQSWASYYTQDADASVINEWRHRVIKDPMEFLRMCQELRLVPDVWSLYEWTDWLTPLHGPGRRRFDTAFFVCCVDGKPHVAEDEGETVHSQWGSPYDIIHQYYQTRVGLAPPQVYEIRRLMEFSTVSELLRFSWHCGKHRVERWLPIPIVCTDGVVSVLPGDSLYPEDANPEGPPISYSYDKTLAELSVSHPHMNRTYMSADHPRVTHVACNISLPGDHVAPRSTEEIAKSVSVQPKL